MKRHLNYERALRIVAKFVELRESAMREKDEAIRIGTDRGEVENPYNTIVHLANNATERLITIERALDRQSTPQDLRHIGVVVKWLIDDLRMARTSAKHIHMAIIDQLKKNKKETGKYGLLQGLDPNRNIMTEQEDLDRVARRALRHEAMTPAELKVMVFQPKKKETRKTVKSMSIPAMERSGRYTKQEIADEAGRRQAARDVRKIKRASKKGVKAPKFYVTTYCNKPHALDTGKPIKHQCITIPPRALEYEMAGNMTAAIKSMQITRGF